MSKNWRNFLSSIKLRSFVIVVINRNFLFLDSSLIIDQSGKFVNMENEILQIILHERNYKTKIHGVTWQTNFHACHMISINISCVYQQRRFFNQFDKS